MNDVNTLDINGAHAVPSSCKSCSHPLPLKSEMQDTDPIAFGYCDGKCMNNVIDAATSWVDYWKEEVRHARETTEMYTDWVSQIREAVKYPPKKEG